MAHENEKVLRRGYEAFSKADLAAINDLFADDITWHVAGTNPLSGDYTGKDAVFDYLSKVITLTDGTLQLEVHDIVANDEHGVVLTRTTARRGDKVLDIPVVHVFHLKDGKAVEFWDFPGDQYLDDAFFA